MPLLVRDDEDQYGRTELLLRRVTLARVYGFRASLWPKSPGCCVARTSLIARPAAALHRLIAIDGVHLEDGPTTRLALAAFEAECADSADYFILESARRAEVIPLHTFEGRLSRSDGAKVVD